MVPEVTKVAGFAQKSDEHYIPVDQIEALLRDAVKRDGLKMGETWGFDGMGGVFTTATPIEKTPPAQYAGFTPRAGHVLLKRVIDPDTMVQMERVLLPGTELEERERLSQWGVVHAIGEGVESVKPGDVIVMHKKWGGHDVPMVVDGEPCHFLVAREDQIGAVLQEGDES